jgi:hypothetical protein
MAAIKHDRPDVHCVIAPASAAPPPVEQQACPDAPHAPHIPGVPVLSSRPAQPSPGVQEPLPPVPQQTWPEAPHAEQRSPVGERTQLSPVLHDIPLSQHG